MTHKSREQIEKEYATHTPRPFGRTESWIVGLYGFISTAVALRSFVGMVPAAQQGSEVPFFLIWAAGTLTPWALVRGAQSRWDSEVLKRYLADSNSDEIELATNVPKQAHTPTAVALAARPGTVERLTVLARALRQSETPRSQQIAERIERGLTEHFGVEINPQGRSGETVGEPGSSSGEDVDFGRIGGFPRPRSTEETAVAPQAGPSVVAAGGVSADKTMIAAADLVVRFAGGFDVAEVEPPPPAVSNEPDAIFVAPEWDGVRHLPFKAVYYDCWDMYRDDTLYPIGCFATLGEAEAACRAFVDRQLLDGLGQPAQEAGPQGPATDDLAPSPIDVQKVADGLVDGLLTFGTMPMILGGPTPRTFSGLDYANTRAIELVRAMALPPATA